jgi:hypothetical protein
VAINPPTRAAAKPTVVNCQILVEEADEVASGEIWGVGVGRGVGEAKTSWVGWEVGAAVGETVAVGGRTIVVTGLGLKIGAGVGVGVGVLKIPEGRGIILGKVARETTEENLNKRPKTSKKIKNFLTIEPIISP